MTKSGRRFSSRFKLALDAAREIKPIAEFPGGHGVHPSRIGHMK